MEASGHAFEEHTAEVQVRLWSPTLAGLFTEAAAVLAELMAGGPVREEGSAELPVALEARDRDALLVDWLNELIYRTEMSGRLQTAVRIDQLTNCSLHGSTGGVDQPAPAVEVKAATLHGLRIAEGAKGYSATVILDV